MTRSPQSDPDVLASRIRSVLEEHPHKPPRVVSKLIAEVIRPTAPVAAPPAVDAPLVVLHNKTLPDPEAWVEFRQRLQSDPIEAMVDAGVATTRNRTHNAFRALGLDPTTVRAVVIEHDWLRIYRYDPPASNQPSVPQTVPILGETA